LYDTALREVRVLEPRDPGRLSIYVCGPTVDSEPHIGHGRFALIWDVLRRYLEWSGLNVQFVTNVTDIEDKIIARANEDGRDPADLALENEKVWWDTMDRLAVKRPTEDPHATAYVDRMIELITELVERGRAYQGTDGVYFSTDTVEDYGLLAPGPLKNLMAGARVAVDEEHGKRDPNDFALWKAAKPGEPWWDSPWGPGRPGWHTECVVMSLDLLGEGFDLHGGGVDLAFPHHENERAQAVADGKRFARRWTHSGHLFAEGGEKMSKSLGNVISLSDLVSRYDPRAYRLLVLQSHYRKPMTVSEATLTAAQHAIERLDAFARRFREANVAAADPGAIAAFRERMDDDLDTVSAVAQLFELVTRANTLADEGHAQEAAALAAAVFEMGEAVGLTLGSSGAEVDDDAARLAAERDDARQKKDYARADAIRQQLVARGWIVEDTPRGTIIRR
jgi:cysteinyl-tRNA synthetase